MQKLSLIFDKYLFWAVLGLFIFIPLYPKFPLLNVPGTYVAIRAEDFLIALVTFAWFIVIFPKLKRFLNLTTTQLFLLFWSIGALSLFSGIFLTQTVTPHLGVFHYLRRIETMILFFVALNAFKSLHQVRIWLIVMLITAIIVIIYGFGQQWLHLPVISTTNREFSKGLILFLSPEARVNSTFAGHYDLAAYLAIFLTLVASVFFYSKKIYQKAILTLTGFFGFILLAMTAARVSFAAAILGMSAVFWMVGQKKMVTLIIGLAIFALIVSPDLRHRTIATFTVNIYGGGGPKYTPPPQKENATKHFSIENAAPGTATPSGVPIDIAPGEPLNTTELGVYRSFGIRFNEEWPRAIRAFLKNPLLGTGYSSITIATDNDYLRSLGETGILGTLSLALIFILIVKRMWQFLRKRHKTLSFYLVGGMLCGLITVFVTGTFIDILESSKISQLLWLSLGATLAVIKLEEKSG